MTDKELIECAAGAIQLKFSPKEYHAKHGLWAMVAPPCYGHWNPLLNNCDAFCLAIVLKLTIGEGWAECSAGKFTAPELFQESPTDATRRAIVLAAAALFLARQKGFEPVV